MNFLKKLPVVSLKTFCDCYNRNFAPTFFKRPIHNSSKCLSLNEFFDDKKNWGVNEVKAGRGWRKEELRLKSNTDLHKLWYILLKERNMLLTMEEESKQEVRLFPNPERLDKVEESMENLEAVVKERNVAYHMLETGKSGVREIKTIKSVFGLDVEHTEQEYLIPKEQNKDWLQEHTFNDDDPDIRKFLVLYREQEARKRKQANTRDFNHVIGLMKRFPNMDMEAVKEQYPNVDIEKAKRSRKYRCHSVPEMYNFK